MGACICVKGWRETNWFFALTESPGKSLQAMAWSSCNQTSRKIFQCQSCWQSARQKEKGKWAVNAIVRCSVLTLCLRARSKSVYGELQNSSESGFQHLPREVTPQYNIFPVIGRLYFCLFHPITSICYIYRVLAMCLGPLRRSVVSPLPLVSKWVYLTCVRWCLFSHPN